MSTAIYEDAIKETIELGGLINICEPDVRAAFRLKGDTYQNIGYSQNPDRTKRNNEAFHNATKEINTNLKKVGGIIVTLACDEDFSYDEFEALSAYICDAFEFHEMKNNIIIQSSTLIQPKGTSRVFVALTGI
jgi:hypothetical protein